MFRVHRWNAAKRLNPPVTTMFELEDAAKAHAAIESGRTVCSRITPLLSQHLVGSRSVCFLLFPMMLNADREACAAHGCRCCCGFISCDQCSRSITVQVQVIPPSIPLQHLAESRAFRRCGTADVPLKWFWQHRQVANTSHSRNHLSHSHARCRHGAHHCGGAGVAQRSVM